MRVLGGPDRSELGQVAPLVAVAVLLVAGVGVAIVAVGGVLADRAVARTAADAAALVAAVDSDAAAASMARANGAELVAVHRHGDQVEVEVRVGRATARARAEVTRRAGSADRSSARPPTARSSRDLIP